MSSSSSLSSLDSLAPEEYQRYGRHLLLPNFGESGQLRLKRSHLLMVGAGGLGGPALLYLAAAGVGHLTIIDPDRVELSNLQRQILFTTADLGQPKAAVAAARLQALNPCIHITPLVARFDSANALSLLQDCDLLIDGSDNFATRYLVNDACVIAQKPFIYGAIHRFEGQLSVFNYRQGPTYRCLFPEEPSPDTAPNCSEAGVLGVLPGLIGTAQACEAIKVLTGIGEPLSGRLMLWDALSMQTRLITLAASPTRHDIRLLPIPSPETCCHTRQASAPANDEIDVPTLRLRLSHTSKPPLQLIDVREASERLTDGIMEMDAHHPLASLSQLGSLPGLDPSAETVVYCAGGARSLRALKLLQTRFGFSSIKSLHGGIKAWKQS